MNPAGSETDLPHEHTKRIHTQITRNLFQKTTDEDNISTLRKRCDVNTSESSNVKVKLQSGENTLMINDKVNDNNMKGAVAQKPTSQLFTNCFLEISIRILLFIVFIQLERAPAFKREIQPEELWLYKYHPKKDYVPASILMPASFIVPFTIICLNFLLTHDRYDFIKSLSVICLAIPLNGVLTSLLKITVGRPRPDFYYRCFPDGVLKDNMNCTGDERIINEGRKSFPSGHSSFAFAGFGFVFLYLAAKLHVFNEKGRCQSWRLCVSTVPLLISLLVAISRTCDYHHHWEDVVVGSIIGLCITFVCYRQYYPSIFSSNSHKPYSKNSPISGKCYVAVTESKPQEDQAPLIEEEKDSKWI